MRAEYVCDVVYSELANAFANCMDCGWPISKHRWRALVDTTPGPFKPDKAPVDALRKVTDVDIEDVLGHWRTANGNDYQRIMHTTTIKALEELQARRRAFEAGGGT